MKLLGQKYFPKLLKGLKNGGTMCSEQIHVDMFAEYILKNRKFRKQAYCHFVDNCYELENVIGVISATKLNSVIQKAKWSRQICILLTGLLAYADASSISPLNFQLILHFPYKIKSTYLSMLCHMELSFFQMQELNRHPLAYEAFCWLFDKICYYDCFTLQDMMQILKENPDASVSAIRVCIQTARESYGESDKLTAAGTWIEQLPPNSMHQP